MSQIYDRRPVAIPAPGVQSVRNPTPTANSPAPRFDGWGTPPYVQKKIQPVEEFTISCSGFLSLVQAEYDRLSSVKDTKLIPFSLFQYMMIMAWWRRALEAAASNRELNSYERSALTTLQRIGKIWVTPRLADALSLIGDRFTYQGVEFALTIEQNTYKGFSVFTKTEGFLPTEGGVEVNGDTMRWYAHRPSPGIALAAVWNALGVVPGQAYPMMPFPQDLLPRPSVIPGAETIEATASLLGWHPNQETAAKLGCHNNQFGSAKVRLRASEWSSKLLDSFGRWKCEYDHETTWLISPSLLDFANTALSATEIELIDFFSVCESIEGSPLLLSYLRVFDSSAIATDPVGRHVSTHPTLGVPMELRSIAITNGVDLALAVGCGFGLCLSGAGEDISRFSPFVGVTSEGVIIPPPDYVHKADLAFGVQNINCASYFLDHCTEVENRYRHLTS